VFSNDEEIEVRDVLFEVVANTEEIGTKRTPDEMEKNKSPIKKCLTFLFIQI
jgi:hypothetical protein